MAEEQGSTWKWQFDPAQFGMWKDSWFDLGFLQDQEKQGSFAFPLPKDQLFVGGLSSWQEHWRSTLGQGPARELLKDWVKYLFWMGGVLLKDSPESELVKAERLEITSDDVLDQALASLKTEEIMPLGTAFLNQGMSYDQALEAAFYSALLKAIRDGAKVAHPGPAIRPVEWDKFTTPTFTIWTGFDVDLSKDVQRRTVLESLVAEIWPTLKKVYGSQEGARIANQIAYSKLSTSLSLLSDFFRSAWKEYEKDDETKELRDLLLWGFFDTYSGAVGEEILFLPYLLNMVSSMSVSRLASVPEAVSFATQDWSLVLEGPSGLTYLNTGKFSVEDWARMVLESGLLGKIAPFAFQEFQRLIQEGAKKTYDLYGAWWSGFLQYAQNVNESALSVKELNLTSQAYVAIGEDGHLYLALPLLEDMAGDPTLAMGSETRPLIRLGDRKVTANFVGPVGAEDILRQFAPVNQSFLDLLPEELRKEMLGQPLMMYWVIAGVAPALLPVVSDLTAQAASAFAKGGYLWDIGETTPENARQLLMSTPTVTMQYISINRDLDPLDELVVKIARSGQLAPSSDVSNGFIQSQGQKNYSIARYSGTLESQPFLQQVAADALHLLWVFPSEIWRKPGVMPIPEIIPMDLQGQIDPKAWGKTREKYLQYARAATESPDYLAQKRNWESLMTAVLGPFLQDWEIKGILEQARPGESIWDALERFQNSPSALQGRVAELILDVAKFVEKQRSHTIPFFTRTAWESYWDNVRSSLSQMRPEVLERVDRRQVLEEILLSGRSRTYEQAAKEAQEAAGAEGEGATEQGTNAVSGAPQLVQRISMV